MDLSIIIITFNSIHCIEQCIADALTSLEKSGFEGQICLFENGSTDGTTALLKNLQISVSNLSVIYSEHNLGTTKSRNAAIELSTGKNILVLDSDAFLTTESLVGMVEYLGNHPEYGLVAPMLTYKSGNFQLSFDDFPTVQRKLQRYLFLKNIERHNVEGQDEIDVDYLISACWLFTREVYDKVGPLDEKIFYAPEDVDYCLRIWKAGYKIGYLPRYDMVHDAQELSRGIKFNRFTYLHIKGLLYYFLKHGYMFRLQGLRDKILRVQTSNTKPT